MRGWSGGMEPLGQKRENRRNWHQKTIVHFCFFQAAGEIPIGHPRNGMRKRLRNEGNLVRPVSRAVDARRWEERPF